MIITRKHILYLLSLLAAGSLLSSCSLLPKPSPAPEAADMASVTQPVKERVYMDECLATALNFDGQNLRVLIGQTSYILDMRTVSLDFPEGLAAGQEISLIFNGKLEGSDPLSATLLKAAEVIHPKNGLKEQVFSGTLDEMTESTLTLTGSDGRHIRFTTAGVPQYYASGIRPGMTVYVHYFGQLPDDPGDGSVAVSRLLRILHISDTEPYTPPVIAPTSTPSPLTPQHDREASQGHSARSGTLVAISGQGASFRVDGQDEPLSVSLSGGAVFFPTGTFLGQTVRVTSLPSPQETSSSQEASSLQAAVSLTGEDVQTHWAVPSGAYLSGIVTGTSANTLTLIDENGAYVTFNTNGMQDLSSQPLSEGSSLRIYPDLSHRAGSNFLTASRAEDTWQ